MGTTIRTGKSWVTLLYFYVGALVGLVVLITGVLIALNALVDVIFFEAPPSPPEEFGEFGDLGGFTSDDDRGDKFEVLVRGLLTAGVGFVVFWWHLRHARRSEEGPAIDRTSGPTTPNN